MGVLLLPPGLSPPASVRPASAHVCEPLSVPIRGLRPAPHPSAHTSTHTGLCPAPGAQSPYPLRLVSLCLSLSLSFLLSFSMSHSLVFSPSLIWPHCAMGLERCPSHSPPLCPYTHTHTHTRTRVRTHTHKCALLQKYSQTADKLKPEKGVINQGRLHARAQAETIHREDRSV